jgi:hypothetical protein
MSWLGSFRTAGGLCPAGRREAGALHFPPLAGHVSTGTLVTV